MVVAVVLVARLCPTLCDPTDCSPPGSSVHGDSPGKNTGVGCHALLQEIFPTQGLNLGLLHCRQILYCLSYREDLPTTVTIYQIPFIPLATLKDDLVCLLVSFFIINLLPLEEKLHEGRDCVCLDHYYISSA